MPDVEWRSRGAEKVLRDHQNETKAVKEKGEAYKSALRDQREMGRLVARVTRENETAQERYTRQLALSKRALDEERISTKAFQNEVTRLTIAHLRETDANKKLLEIRRQSAAVAQRELATLPQLTSFHSRLAAEYTREGVQLSAINMRRTAAFGPTALGQLGAFAGRLGGIAGALLLVNQGLAEAEMRRSAAGLAAFGAGDAIGGLSQLALGDRAKFAGLMSATRASFGEGGFDTLQDAAGLTFELESGGNLADRKFLSGVQAAGVTNAAAFAKGGSLVQSAFGRGEAGTLEALMSKGLAAAGPAPGAELSDIMSGVVQASATAKQLGLADEEVFGLVSQLAEVTGSGEEAGTWANSLFRSLVRMGFADDATKQSLPAMMKELTGRGRLPSELIKDLGRQEAAQAFDIARDSGSLAARIADVDASQRTGLARDTVAMAMSEPTIATRQQVRATRARAQLAAEPEGLRQQRIEATNESRRAALDANLPSILSGPLNSIIDRGARFLPSSLADPGLPGESMDDLAKLLDRQTQLLEEQNRIMRDDQRRGPRPTGRRE